MENRYDRILCGNIARLRREHGLTQEGLADKLGVTFQAVSKWENALSCPDVTLLPELADIFSVSMDVLFGRKSATESDVPWDDDGEASCGRFLRKKACFGPRI
ncbi:MAG: helix-turn-helix transcriptional regulator [Clostridia bacterium]|nr:helix-turn-helix transcriptional regulator [Clostridia bacterium]